LVKTFGRLQILWADGGYLGALVGVGQKALRPFGRLRNLDIVRRSDQAKGFKVLPRTLDCGTNLRLALQIAADCAATMKCGLDHSEAMVRICMIRLMVSRLA
jgi:hypothetical protein